MGQTWSNEALAQRPGKRDTAATTKQVVVCRWRYKRLAAGLAVGQLVSGLCGALLDILFSASMNDGVLLHFWFMVYSQGTQCNTALMLRFCPGTPFHPIASQPIQRHANKTLALM